MAISYATEAIVEALLEGVEPSLEGAPHLDSWSYKINEKRGIIVFYGRVWRHPHIDDLKFIHTSRVKWCDPAFRYIVTENRAYVLDNRKGGGIDE